MTPIDLWNLLPSAHRIDDAARGYPLRTLLNIISQQANVVKTNIDDLWDDYFIETCAEWVIPYIGDLVGSRPIYQVLRGSRADVARTIYFRRRKGTLPMLEELARYVLGWSVHAVAFFDLLTWTQNMNHLRPTVGTVDVRNLDGVNRIQTAFDIFSHSIDVRPATQTEGWHQISRIGFFIWRLVSYHLFSVVARRSVLHPHGYHFSPLGNPIPLFHQAEREIDESALASELHVDSPIRPTAFYQAKKNYYLETPGPNKVPPGLSIWVDGARIEPEAVMCMSLSDWKRPVTPNIRIGIDVSLGRFTFAELQEPADPTSVRVSYDYGFSADLGGGPYLRDHLQGRQSALENVGLTIGAHLVARAADETVTLEIQNSDTYRENINFNHSGLSLTLQAKNGSRPLIIGTLTIGANAPEHLVLDGLLIEGFIEVAPNSRLKDLTLKHCTLVPGRALDEDGMPRQAGQPSLLVNPGNDDLSIVLDSCITGWLQVPEAVNTLTIRDSIIDSLAASPAIAGNAAGTQPAPRTTLDRVTVFGTVFVKEMTRVSDTLFTDRVISQRRQTGCVRFSYVPEGSETPRRFRCQPDTAIEGLDSTRIPRVLDRLTPIFTSRHYGHPAYAQLALITAPELRQGADNGSEMGVFSQLMQPQREANLKTRLSEYLPFGLEPVFIYVT